MFLSEMCKNKHIDPQMCYPKYEQCCEEDENFCIGWKNTPCDPKEKVYKYTSDAWKFTRSWDIWGMPLAGYYTTYGGGGYIANLDVNRWTSQAVIEELYINKWIDRQTRAVMLEFTLYCINTNTFTYNVFMVEFPETGGAFPCYLIYPIKVYQHLGPMGLYTLVCEVLFVFYLVILTVIHIVNMVQQKKSYFKKVWQVYDLLFIILSYVAIALYIVRTVMTDLSLKRFHEDKKAFVNFYHIALWNFGLVFLIGALCFMTTLRMLNFLGYNKRIGALARVFSKAANDLVYFGMFFTIIFVGYSALGYLLFGTTLTSYMTVFKAMSTLFTNMIGMIRFKEIDNSYPVLSKIYFMVFIFVVVYMILTIFLSMLSQAIDETHRETKTSMNDEMVDYAIKKLKNFFTYGKNLSRSSRNRSSGN